MVRVQEKALFCKPPGATETPVQSAWERGDHGSRAPDLGGRALPRAVVTHQVQVQLLGTRGATHPRHRETRGRCTEERGCLRLEGWGWGGQGLRGVLPESPGNFCPRDLLPKNACWRSVGEPSLECLRESAVTKYMHSRVISFLKM